MNKRSNLLNKISKIISEGEPEKIIEKLISLEQENPKDVPIKQALSNQYIGIGDNANARKYLEEALQIEPNNYATNFNLGEMYLSFNREDEAIKFFLDSVKSKKDLFIGFNALGKIFYKKRQYNKALYYYRKSIEINKEKSNIIAIKQYGICLYQEFLSTKNIINLKECIKIYEFAFNLDKNNYDIIMRLSALYHKAGRKNEAVAISRKIFGVFIFDTSKNTLKISL